MSGIRPGGHFRPLKDGDPTVVAGYRLVARLGEGGMGTVYPSYTPGGHPIAVKTIRPELSGDPGFRRRFRQEVQAARRVQGLYTAPILDHDTEATPPWLTTAQVPGPSPASAVAEHGPLPVQTVLLLWAAEEGGAARPGLQGLPAMCTHRRRPHGPGHDPGGRLRERPRRLHHRGHHGVAER